MNRAERIAKRLLTPRRGSAGRRLAKLARDSRELDTFMATWMFEHAGDSKIATWLRKHPMPEDFRGSEMLWAFLKMRDVDAKPNKFLAGLKKVARVVVPIVRLVRKLKGM